MRIDPALDIAAAGGLAVMGAVAVLYFAIQRRDQAPLWLGLFNGALATHFAFADQAVAGQAALGFLALFLHSMYPKDCPALGARVVAAAAFAGAAMSIVPGLLPTLAFRTIVLGGAAWLAWRLARAAYVRPKPWPALLLGMPVLLPLLMLQIFRGAVPAWVMVPLVFAAFIAAPVMVLSRRFIRAFDSSVSRSEEDRSRVGKLDQQLRNQTKYTIDVLDSVPVALTLRDETGKYLFVNRQWEQWFEARDRTVGSTVQQRLSPDAAKEVLALDRAALDRGPGAPPQRDDIEFNGRRYTQTRSVMTDADGKVVGLLVATIDTTERTEQELQLRNQMALTRGVIDENPNAISVKDKEGRYVTVNDAWVKQIGVPREQALGKTIVELFGTEESKRHHAVDMQLIEKRRGSSELDTLRTGPDGNPQYLIVRKAVLRDGEGYVSGIIGTNTDITAIKQYERQLADRNKFITEVIEALPVSVGIRDLEGRHVQVNRTWEKYYNLDRADVVGKRFDELAGWNEDPELVEFGRQSVVLDQETIARGLEVAPEPVERRRKGRVYLNTRRALVDTEGHPFGIVGVALDVTDQRSLESQLQRQKAILETTLENIDQGITMIDRELRIMAFNWRFLELLEFPANLFAHQPTLEQVFRYNAKRGEYGPGDIEEQVRTRLELARKFEPHYFERKRPNGTVLAIRGQPLPDGAGFVTTYTDITEQKKAEEELRANVALREEVERMSRHDLKTPINSVIAVSRMLRENTRLSPDDAELLATVERAGYRILDMVNLSLDLFRMEQGTYEFRPQVIDLGEVAARVATDLQGQAASKRVFVRVTGAGLASAQAEELLCYSMLANLVKNAIEAAPEGTEVAIELEREGDWAYVRVKNQGLVPESVRGRFFQKYTTAGKSAGVGLGAYSARLLARVQRGELTLDDQTGTATTLTVRLRAADPIHLKTKRDIAPKPIDLTVQPELPPLRVVLADDDEFNRIVLKRLLPAPLRVTMAVNGRGAVDAALEEWPDVVLLDLEMPVMDGYEAARKLREVERVMHRRNLLIVAISSNDDESIVKRALDAGCDQYLVKPASRGILWQILSGVKVPIASGGSPAAEVASTDEVVLDPDLEPTLHGFLESRRQALDEMPRALEAGDRAAFTRLAHRLAGSFALYGFKWAAAESKAIERDSAEGDAGQLAARAAALRKYLDAVRVRVAHRDGMTS